MSTISFAKVIDKSIRINASLEDLWRVWTTSSGAKEFFAPNVIIELYPGGRFEVLFDSSQPEGLQGSEGVKVLSLIPNEMLSFEWNAPPQFPDIRKDRTFVVLNFVSLDQKNSEVRLRHLGWREGDDWDQVYNYFDRAWSVVLENLDRRFKSGPMVWSE